MRALTIRPGEGNPPEVVELPEPDPAEGPVLVQSLAVGICGTDRELLAGDGYGAPPPGADRLVLGHEGLGRVLAGPGTGDLVVGMVRHPDPAPCPPCAAGEWDRCANGDYTEHGIRGRHGFARERWRTTPDRLVRLDPALDRVGVLLEPASIVAKAWEGIERVTGPGRHTVLVTGAGPIGLLAALLGAQLGHDVHVLDLAADGPKPALAGELGTYHTADPPEADVVVECTGAPEVVAAVLAGLPRNGTLCLTGVSPHPVPVELTRDLVLFNQVVLGTVNANRRHYERAAAALRAADRSWLERMITSRVPLDQAAGAFGPTADIKVVLEVAA